MKHLKLTSCLVASLLMSLIVVSCAPSAQIESAKIAGYDKTPKKVLVLFQSGTVTPLIRIGFDEVLQGSLRNCSIDMYSEYFSRNKGTDNTASSLEQTYNPDWELQVIVTEVEAEQNALNREGIAAANILAASFNFTVVDQLENQKIWRANVSVPLRQPFFLGDRIEPGRVAARAVIKSLEEDGFLGSCAAPQAP